MGRHAGRGLDEHRALNAEPSIKYYAESLQNRLKNFDPQKVRAQYEDALAKWRADSEAAKQAGKPAPKQPNMPAAPGTSPNEGSTLYNGMIAPLLPFAIKGAIWYQGESNAGKPIEYRTLYADMILDCARAGATTSRSIACNSPHGSPARARATIGLICGKHRPLPARR